MWQVKFTPGTIGRRRWRFVGRRFWHLLKTPQHTVDISNFAIKDGCFTYEQFDIFGWLNQNLTGYCLVQEVSGYQLDQAGRSDSLAGVIARVTRIMEGSSECGLQLKFTHKSDAILFKMSLP